VFPASDRRLQRSGQKRVSTVELLRNNFGAYSDAALAEPIVVTKNGRDRLIMMSVERYSVLQLAHDAFENTDPKPPQERANRRGEHR
jgi:PHD/YefM family antitoxin component YafN of YafNO toxin-antitoxin module